MEPNVAVLLSAYNGEKYIEQQILSLMNQKRVNVHLIVRDDGSKDKTVSIARHLAEKFENKIEIILGENLGISKSFDYLYRHAGDSEYYAFSDQDDVWDRDKLFIAIQMMKRNDAHFYSSESRLTDANMLPLHRVTGNERKYLHYMNGKSKLLTPGSQGCTIVIDHYFKNLLCSYVPKKIYGYDDYTTVLAFYTVKCIYDKTPHMDYRQHDESWTGNRNKKFASYYKHILYFFKGLSRYSGLAGEMLDGYGKFISENDLIILKEAAASVSSVSARIRLFFMPGFSKYGIKENFVFKVAILFGKI